MFSFEALRRWPDVEAPNLNASDAADRLILDTATDAIVASLPGDIVVLGDRFGALTLGAASLGATGTRVHQDPLSGELALAANAATFGMANSYTSHGLGRELVEGARVVLMQLPRSLDALAEMVDAVADYAAPDVEVFAGGMTKHLALAMNDILRGRFDAVAAGLARQKARVITCSGRRADRAGTGPWPRREFHNDLGLWVCAHGGVFAGTKVDIGTGFLLGLLNQARPDARSVLDLGCGTGLLAVGIARARPGVDVLATDQSAAAVASATATVRANGMADRVVVSRDNGARQLPSGSVDLVLLNPPFHLGSAVHAGAGLALIDEAARVLAPGGELWTVWNSHLGYAAPLERIVGPTRQVARNPKFTVTASTKLSVSA